MRAPCAELPSNISTMGEMCGFKFKLGGKVSWCNTILHECSLALDIKKQRTQNVKQILSVLATDGPTKGQSDYGNNLDYFFVDDM